MPCRSEYLEPTDLEREAGRLRLLLDEVLSRQPVNPEEYRRAVIRNATKAEVDGLTAELCAKLQQAEAPQEFSLELQIWWRDHQAADDAREAQQAQQRRDAKAAALAKLTPHERELLGLLTAEQEKAAGRLPSRVIMGWFTCTRSTDGYGPEETVWEGSQPPRINESPPPGKTKAGFPLIEVPKDTYELLTCFPELEDREQLVPLNEVYRCRVTIQLVAQ